MKVLIKVQPQGLYNGQVVHAKKGEVADLPDELADGLVRGGLAEPVDDEPPTEPEPPKSPVEPEPPVETATVTELAAETATVTELAAETATVTELAAETATAPEPAAETAKVEEPQAEKRTGRRTRSASGA
ncbi:MAG: hypothetical protein K0S43_409 [Cellulosimicrobium sp.]|jgi:hypothetical protein|nr:hypothetical protein [Cellulosimicrobium sp.]